MIIQRTLLTCHKGVDLHAASAVRVMQRRLAGGERLLGLQRAEWHTFWQQQGRPEVLSVERLLDNGRYYNPNKHHFAVCELVDAGPAWNGTGDDHALPAGWPGEGRRTDLPDGAGTILDRLLGGPTTDGQVTVDVCAFPLGEEGPLLSGVVWRLRLPADEPDPVAAATALAVAHDREHGLLVNPLMQGWRLAVAARHRE